MPKPANGNREIIRGLEGIAIELENLEETPARSEAFKTSIELYKDLTKLYAKYNPVAQELWKYEKRFS